MGRTENFAEEEISLFDLFEKLRGGWRWGLGGIVLGVLVAVVLLFVAPEQYEAVAVVQVGQVGQVGRGTQVGIGGQVTSVPAEPAAEAVERMKSSAFLFAVAKAADDQRWMAALQNGRGPSVLSVVLSKGTSQLIDLKVKADSQEAAKKILGAAIQVLAKRHAEITKPAVDRLNHDADLAREKLKRAESELERLNKLTIGVGVTDERFAQISLITDLRVKKEAEIFQQRQMLSDLNGALSTPNTLPAHAIEEVFVSDRPVSPKKGLLLAQGLVGGLLVGVASVFVSCAWRQARGRRSLVDSGKA